MTYKYMPAKNNISLGNKLGVRTWIEIDRAAIKNNISEFRRVVSKPTKIMAVVKSNAYGHGILDFSLEVDKAGADWLGVDSLIEGLTLRKAGVTKPILVLGYTLPERFVEAAAHNISVAISQFEGLEYIAANARRFSAPLKIHLKVDTGMHRQGFLIPQLDRVCKMLKRAGDGKIIVEGVFTHFAAAKNPSFPQDTKRQIAEFAEAVKILESNGFHPMKHAGATAGALLFPEAHFDMVRIGIGIYGLWPAKEVERVWENKIHLKPVLSWKTVIGEVKDLPDGGGVGYDLTEKLPPKSKIAICPVGYWHGFGRSMSSVGHVLVRGARARVVGRVSMDMITIDVSRIKNVAVGDEVVIIGRQGKEEIDADEAAKYSDTTAYEIVTRINPLIKRVVM